ncbi:MAG: hypothetical protein HKP13_02800 [Gammaproteobacteria bacterium]|nr:hypothetical protein [Gammaproteobacteria bacterium]
MDWIHEALSNIWNRFQICLFPGLKEEPVFLTGKQQRLVEVLEITRIESHIP